MSENKLLDAIKIINAKFGNKETNEVPIILEKQDVPVFSSGSLAIDFASNAGGLPQGRIYEFFGAEASGKTTASLKIASQYLKNGKSVCYIDAEQAFSKMWAEKLGIKVSTMEELVKYPQKPHFILVQTSIFEECISIMRTMIESGVKLIIEDSVPMMIPENELSDEEVEGKGMPLFAKNFRRELRKLTSIAAKNQANIIFINHQMNDISKFGFGEKVTTPGGTALKYLSSMRLKFARFQTEKDKNGNKIANKVKVTFVKNKVAAPYGEGVFTLNFANGWDDVQEIIDYAVGTEVVVKENPRLYTYKGEKFASSAPDLDCKIRNNVELQEELKKEIIKAINANKILLDDNGKIKNEEMKEENE